MIRDSDPPAADATAARDRLDRARELLRRAGVPAVVEATGHHSDIAAIRADPRLMPELRRLAPDLRALGFRYVALDVAAQD